MGSELLPECCIRDTKSHITGAGLIVFILACIVGFILRLALAQRGHNYDMDSWTYTAAISIAGHNVYASTSRFNYGPVWMLILNLLGRLHEHVDLSQFGQESFHVIVAGFLSLVDFAVGFCLLRRAGLAAALFFILNPILILLTGYHSQIDTLCILPALLAWMLINPRDNVPPTLRRWVLAACLMGLSLATKHIMLIFVVWIVFCPALMPTLSRRLLFAFIAYGFFGVLFIPFAFAPGAASGIWNWVLGYPGMYVAHSLMPSAIDLVFPLEAIRNAMTFDHFSLIRNSIFLILLTLTGIPIAASRPRELFERYLLALTVLNFSMADQYLAIPLVACAMQWRYWASWVYTFVGTAVLLHSGTNVMMSVVPPPNWVNFFAGYLTYRHAQVWLLFPLLRGLSWRRP